MKKMPRGIKKTYFENIREMEMDREWRERKKPLQSPCLGNRRKHYFGQYNDDPERRCYFCNKSRNDVKRERTNFRKSKG